SFVVYVTIARTKQISPPFVGVRRCHPAHDPFPARWLAVMATGPREESEQGDDRFRPRLMGGPPQRVGEAVDEHSLLSLPAKSLLRRRQRRGFGLRQPLRRS